MKKGFFLIALLISVAGYGQQLNLLNEAAAADTGDHFVLTRIVGSSKTTYRLSIAKLAAYIGASGSVNISNTGLTWTGPYVQNVNDFPLDFSNVTFFRLTDTTPTTMLYADGIYKKVTLGDSAGNKCLSIDYATGAVNVNNEYTLPAADGSANHIMSTNGLGVASWGVNSPASLQLITSYNGTASVGVWAARAAARHTGVTGVGSIVSFVNPALATFNISVNINITAISTDVLNVQVTWIDENLVSQTQKFNPMGVASPNLSTTGNKVFPPVTITAGAGTITVETILQTSGGSHTHNEDAVITQIN